MFDVYRLPINLLAFNIRNGRFAAELRATEKQLGRRLDALMPEDDEVIRKLLLNQDEFATGLLKDDIRKVGQTDPGIITHDGFVINGNRRMAVLQALHDEDRTSKYRFFPRELEKRTCGGSRRAFSCRAINGLNMAR
jgi:hypothetical protein